MLTTFPLASPTPESGGPVPEKGDPAAGVLFRNMLAKLGFPIAPKVSAGEAPPQGESSGQTVPPGVEPAVEVGVDVAQSSPVAPDSPHEFEPADSDLALTLASSDAIDGVPDSDSALPVVSVTPPAAPPRWSGDSALSRAVLQSRLAPILSPGIPTPERLAPEAVIAPDSGAQAEMVAPAEEVGGNKASFVGADKAVPHPLTQGQAALPRGESAPSRVLSDPQAPPEPPEVLPSKPLVVQPISAPQLAAVAPVVPGPAPLATALATAPPDTAGASQPPMPVPVPVPAGRPEWFLAASAARPVMATPVEAQSTAPVTAPRPTSPAANPVVPGGAPVHGAAQTAFTLQPVANSPVPMPAPPLAAPAPTAVTGGPGASRRPVAQTPPISHAPLAPVVLPRPAVPEPGVPEATAPDGTTRESAAPESLRHDSARIDPIRIEPARIEPPKPGAPPPAALARQIADVLPAPDGPGFDLALSPEELGQVRLRLLSVEGGSLLIIHAERPETLDLMRRHIGTLEQELRDLGHDGLQMRFSSGGGDQGAQRQPAQIDAPSSGPLTAISSRDTAEAPRPGPAPTAGSRDHLDLRL